MTKVRNQRIDLLRFIGLSMIIAAHVGPPAWLFQLRSFEVPLMVMISGSSFILANSRSSYLKYIKRRFLRLVCPTWIFLTILFLSEKLFNWPAPLPGFQKIVASYVLFGGIGYVWVIRVFFQISLIAPVLIKMKERFGDKRALLLLGVLFSVYSTYIWMTNPGEHAILYKVALEYIAYIIPYGMLFYLGVVVESGSAKWVKPLLIISGALCIGCFIGVNFGASKLSLSSAHKYPPDAYYLSYGIFCSLILYMASDFLVEIIKKLRIDRFVWFIAQNSIWIYLWHIVFVVAIEAGPAIKYIEVYAFAIGCYSVQWGIVRAITQGVKKSTSDRIILTIFRG